MFCASCGKEINGNSRFCEHCGNSAAGKALGPARRQPVAAGVFLIFSAVSFVVMICFLVPFIKTAIDDADRLKDTDAVVILVLTALAFLMALLSLISLAISSRGQGKNSLEALIMIFSIVIMIVTVVIVLAVLLLFSTSMFLRPNIRNDFFPGRLD